MQVLRPISLRWLVPAISAAVLATVVAVFGTMAYQAVKRSALEVAGERLQLAASALVQPPAQAPAWTRELGEVARSPAVAGVVQSGGQRVSDDVRELMLGLTTDSVLTLAADIRDVSGNVLFSVAGRVAQSAPNDSASPAQPQRDSLDLARVVSSIPRQKRPYADSAEQSLFQMSDRGVMYERAVPIRDRGRVIGHVVQIRSVAATANALRTISSLIGPGAALVVGNKDGSLWSDLSRQIGHPPVSDSVQSYGRDGRRWLSAVTPVVTAPWVIGVEIPEDVVLAPVNRLGTRFLIIGAVIILLATVVAERLSRQLTRPLISLTGAAEDIASGHRSTPVIALSRSDELGRLSRAFAAMAESIQTSHDTLEFQIGERTEELSAALTRLQEAQEELIRKEKLATLGQVSGSIAHELRNPLGVMTNALFYLSTVLEDAPPKVREHLAKVRAQVRLSESIINGLLSFTRSGPPSLEQINVAQMIQEQLVRAVPPETVTVQCDVPADIPALRADPVHVAQILMNLFTNALQAMGTAPGVLSISASQVGDRVRLVIGDSGPGISPENRERVFEPLFTTKARGIGLGLSVSRSLANANGGTLEVVPTAAGGSGATIALELPAFSLVRDAQPNPQLQGSTTMVL